jgi:glycosyltransferase involved in cell wall biosynthesis
MLTIIIPSKNELFLNNTIRDVLLNSRGEIEVIPVLDGYEPDELVKDDRVKYLRLEKNEASQKRQGINQAVEIAKGEYIMALDAHCMLAPGYDLQLIKDHQPNWVQIPRRNRLEAETWSLQQQADDRPPIDYEYIMFNPLLKTKSMHGFKWDVRTNERADIMLDDTMEFQGSCWFMTKEWFKKNGFMDVKYQGWGQEAEEIGLTTWKNGGRVVTNKNTWYAHLHKGPKWGRMYHLSKSENLRSYEYAYKFWLIDNKEFFIKFIEKFWPIPGWPVNWKELIWKT